MKTIFFAILWLSPVINALLYWYRKRVVKRLKEEKFFKAGVDVHKVIIGGVKNWFWFRHLFEDFILKVFLSAIPAIILKDVVLFFILLSIGLAALVLKIGITLYPFPFPVLFWSKGVWTFYRFTFYYARGFGAFILGVLAPAAVLLGIGDLFMTKPMFLSEPTVLARFLDDTVGKTPIWLYYVVIIPFIVAMVANIFYLWLKIAPLLTRFYMEYNNDVLRLMNRMSKKEIARIDFKKPYAYEQAFDARKTFSTPGEMPAHVFFQDSKAIALTVPSGPSQSFGKQTVRGHWLGMVSTVWGAKLSAKAGTTYVVNPEESDEFFGEIIKKHWKKN